METIHEDTILEDFIKRIRMRREEEAQEILKKAEEEAMKIIEAAKEEARIKALKEAERIVQEAESKSIMMKRIAETKARLTYRLRILQEKNKLIEAVFENVMEFLKEKVVPSAEYEKILEKLILEAAVAIGGGELKVILSKPCQLDFENLAKVVEEKTGVKTKFETILKPMSFIGGALVTNKDESVIFDNTFEGRIKRMKKDLIREVSRILFQDVERPSPKGG
ncbi:MAG: V-type ATP synthase subunit E family protein [Candidatus Bathyarchaeia archaeon]